MVGVTAPTMAGGILGTASGNSSWVKCIVSNCKNDGSYNVTNGTYGGTICGNNRGLTIK